MFHSLYDRKRPCNSGFKESMPLKAVFPRICFLFFKTHQYWNKTTYYYCIFTFSHDLFIKMELSCCLIFLTILQNSSRTLYNKMSGFLRTGVLPVNIHHLPILIFFTSKPIYIASKPPIIAIFSVFHSRNFLKNIRFKRYGYILMLGLWYFQNAFTVVLILRIHCYL